MRRLSAIFIALIVGMCAGMAQSSYADTNAKALRFFGNKEWSSSAAYYTLLIHEKPEEAEPYWRCIVSNEMLGDSLRSMQLLGQAMSYGVSLDAVLAGIKDCSFEIGKGDMYEQFLLQAGESYPWLSRPIDRALLNYYAYRRNGNQMVAYAAKMLAGAPNNSGFISTMAEGYMLLGQADKAVECWNRMIEIDPNDLQAILCLANYYDITSNPTQALFYFKRAYQLRQTPYVADAIERLEGPKK